MKKRKFLIAIISAISIFITASVSLIPCHAYNNGELTQICYEIMDSAEKLMSDEASVSQINDWLAYSLALAGRKSETYLSKLHEYVRQEYDKNGGFNLTTDYCRLSLVLNALGENPDKIPYNNGGYISLLSDGIFNSDGFGKQGLNAYIWALITLGECAEKTPETEAEINSLIDFILLSELENGGFAVQGSSPNPDVTAQAVKALAPYAENNGDVRQTVERCKQLLISMKNSDGTYSSFGVPNTETTAQAAIAFTALNEKEQLGGAISALMTFYVKNDSEAGFLHSKTDGNISLTATAQGLEALILYLKSEEVVFEQDEQNIPNDILSGMGAYINIALIMVLIFVLLIVMERVAKHKKKEHKED